MSLSTFMLFLKATLTIKSITMDAWKTVIATIVPILDAKSLAFETKEYVKLSIMKTVDILLKENYRAWEDPPPVEEIVDYAVEQICLLRTAHMKEMKEAMSPIKEGLAAAAFHPSRVERLIDAHGFDVLDYI